MTTRTWNAEFIKARTKQRGAPIDEALIRAWIKDGCPSGALKYILEYHKHPWAFNVDEVLARLSLEDKPAAAAAVPAAPAAAPRFEWSDEEVARTSSAPAAAAAIASSSYVKPAAAAPPTRQPTSLQSASSSCQNSGTAAAAAASPTPPSRQPSITSSNASSEYQNYVNAAAAPAACQSAPALARPAASSYQNNGTAVVAAPPTRRPTVAQSASSSYNGTAVVAAPAEQAASTTRRLYKDEYVKARTKKRGSPLDEGLIRAWIGEGCPPAMLKMIMENCGHVYDERMYEQYAAEQAAALAAASELAARAAAAAAAAAPSVTLTPRPVRPNNGVAKTSRHQPQSTKPNNILPVMYDEDDEWLIDRSEKLTPVYTLSVTEERVCLFEPYKKEFFEMNREYISLRCIEEGAVYHSTDLTDYGCDDLAMPSFLVRKQYLERAECDFESVDDYRQHILPAILLGSRVRDFEQRCAMVDRISPLVLTMPDQGGRLEMLSLKTIAGSKFTAEVDFVIGRDEEETAKKLTVHCHQSREPLPSEVKPGSMLEIMCEKGSDLNRVSAALLKTYRNRKAPIHNWSLLSKIYGPSRRQDYPSVAKGNPQIRLAKNRGTVQLNPEQAEAVAMYNCDEIPAFVVESPPGSGKTMTAAAMAVSYKGEGVQLLLSSANVPVYNMALALAKLDYGYLTALHILSPEREAKTSEENRSPFSALSLAMNKNPELNEKISKLEDELKNTTDEEEREKLQRKIQNACSSVFRDKYDVYFATIDMILGRRFKGNSKGKPDDIKKQLLESVTRIIVDEASQLTEAALNTLILYFPRAQIVLIGDSRQMPPFRYTRGDVVSELAARSALEVFEAKRNLPVIKLRCVYRASAELILHYSSVFYEGRLVSIKPDSAKNPLSCFGSKSDGSRCLFWLVDGKMKQTGTSKVNESEIVTLLYIINILRSSGYDEKDVMIISYYEAQRKEAEGIVPTGYEVLTVDSAQGREKKVVIVLTTRTSVPLERGTFFSCPLRCNVAVSRHQEALIVLGHEAVTAAPNWHRILNQKYFKHVDALSI